jgi:diguanylate cyclase (GGDEF)-like protein
LAGPYVLQVQEEKKETAIEHYCTASIGIVVFPYQEAGHEDIMKWADTAMYQAKDSGRNLIRFYDQEE